MRKSKQFTALPPSSYVSRSELGRQLSLSDGVIDRMISKGMLPPPLDFDGNNRWQWSDVEAHIAKNNKIDDHDAEHEIDDIMAGLENVTGEIDTQTSTGRYTR